MKKAKLLLLAMLMVVCLVLAVACVPQHTPLEDATLTVGENEVELYVSDGRNASFTATEAGTYTFSLKTASTTVTFKKVIGETLEDVTLPYTVHVSANQKVTFAIASTATTEKDSVTVVVTKNTVETKVLALGDNEIEWFVDENKLATFTATETAGYTFSLKTASTTAAIKKVVGTTLEDVTLPYTVRLAANETVTLALGSIATTEKDSVTLVVEKADPLPNVELVLGNNPVEFYVADGRTVTFTATEANHYDVYFATGSSKTVTVKRDGEVVEIPYEVTLAEGEKLTLVLSSSATKEIDFVTVVVAKSSLFEDLPLLSSCYNLVEFFSDAGRTVSFTPDQAARYTFSLQTESATVTVKKVVCETLEDVTLPYTVRLEKQERITFALSSSATTEKDSVTFVVKKADPLPNVELVVGENPVEFYVDEGRTVEFFPGKEGRYNISVKGTNETVAFYDGSQPFTLPWNGYLYDDNLVIFDLQSVATTVKDSVTFVVEEDTNNYVASIDVQNKLSPDKGAMSFITMQPYRNITEISFKAKTFTDNTERWWGISLSETIDDADIYTRALGTLPVTGGEWVKFTFAFADGKCTITSSTGYSASKDVENKLYYVYFIAAKGEDFGGNILLDDFTIVANGKTHVDDFQKGFENGLFEADTTWVEGGAPVKEEIVNDIVVKEVTHNYVAHVNTRRHNENGQSFITKTAYTDITEISFKAKTAADATWWGISLSETTDAASIYEMKLGTLSSTNGAWVTFTFTFADGSCTITSSAGYSATKEVANKAYYVYFISSKCDFDYVELDDFVIKTASKTYTENFDNAMDQWLFDVEVEDDATTSPVTRVVDDDMGANANNVASIDIQNLMQSDAGKQQSFITKSTYSNITEISFKAKTGTVASWWGLTLAEDKNTANIYSWNPNKMLSTTNGEWVTFTYTFAEGKCTITSSAGLNEMYDVADKAYYLLIVGSRGETFDGDVLIDDFKIVADGQTYEENFEGNIADWLFDVDQAVTKVAA